MTSPSKLLVYIMGALVALSVALTFWKTIVVRDFLIVDDVELEEE